MMYIRSLFRSLFYFLIISTLFSAALQAEAFGLKGRIVSAGVALTWQTNAYNQVAKQRIYRKDTFSAYKAVTNILKTLTVFTDKIPSVDPAVFYTYKITTVKADGTELEDSNEAEIQTQAGDRTELIRFVNNSASLLAAGTINFYIGISEDGPVQITVLAVNGEIIRTISEQERAAGSYKITWDCRDESNKPVIPGLYIIALKTKTERDWKKAVVTR
jgi:hypothetical protein